MTLRQGLIEGIGSSQVALRPAEDGDRQSIYRWLVDSDVTACMMGPPLFPEVPIPSWDEFCADYVDHFFDDSHLELGRSFIIQRAGESIGHVSYSVVAKDRRTAELDIWMRSDKECGQGEGTEALSLLIRWLAQTGRFDQCIIRPSQRNPRAIQSYQKAGFEPTRLSKAQQNLRFGAGEFYDTMTLIRRLER